MVLLKCTTSSINGKKSDFPGVCAKNFKHESRRWSKIELAMWSSRDRNESLTRRLPRIGVYLIN